MLSASELEQVFQQERARVDRSHSVFSMVVFLPGEGHGACATTVAVLKERMRIYDSIGQLDSRRLALLLPDTDTSGAWVLADDAIARLAEEDLPYNCEVYSYPVDWTQHAQRSPRREHQTPQWSGDDSEGTEATGTAGPSLRVVAPGDGVDGATATQTAPSLKQLRSASDGRPVRDLAPVFVQPLPRVRRLIDIVVAGAALVLLLPVFALVAILIKLDTSGPVFFVQKRAGLGGKHFDFLKFRSMFLDAEQRRKDVLALNQHKTGPIFKLKDDPRITRVGRVLRRTSVDELPQLLNVFRGDMTLIGPRPPRIDEVEKYEGWQRRRLEIMGGLTCIWQVSGRSEIGFEDWVRMDIQYQEKRSVGFDLKLLCKTVGAVLSGRGAY